MQYRLSKYLDNWIWEGSQSRHYNQWRCQQSHWEAESSCTVGAHWGKDWGKCIFGWLTEQGSRSKITWPYDSFTQTEEKCYVKILRISSPVRPWRMTPMCVSFLLMDTKQWNPFFEIWIFNEAISYRCMLYVLLVFLDTTGCTKYESLTLKSPLCRHFCTEVEITKLSQHLKRGINIFSKRRLTL